MPPISKRSTLLFLTLTAVVVAIAITARERTDSRSRGLDPSTPAHKGTGAPSESAAVPGIRVSEVRRSGLEAAEVIALATGRRLLRRADGAWVTRDLRSDELVRVSRPGRVSLIVPVSRLADPAALDLPQPGHIEGRVADEITGLPISEFTVVLTATDESYGLPTWDPPGRRFTNGHFRNEDETVALTARYQVTVSAEGYESAVALADVANEGARLTILLKPSRSLIGTLRWRPSGAAVTEAVVTATWRDGQVRATSDEMGRYLVLGIPRGVVNVTVQHAHLARPYTVELQFIGEEERYSHDLELDRGLTLLCVPNNREGTFAPNTTLELRAVDPPLGFPEDLTKFELEVSGRGAVQIPGVPNCRLVVRVRQTLGPFVVERAVEPEATSTRSIDVPAAATGACEVTLSIAEDAGSQARVRLLRHGVQVAERTVDRASSRAIFEGLEEGAYALAVLLLPGERPATGGAPLISIRAGSTRRVELEVDVAR